VATHYSILGLNPTGLNDAKEPYTQNDITKGYREKSLEVHPDKNPDDRAGADEKFQKVKEAYDVLKNTEKRKAYDKDLHNNPAAFIDDEHIFIITDKAKTDLTQQMRDAKISPETVLHMATQNNELAQKILLNGETLTILPLSQQCELLIIVCAQINAQHSDDAVIKIKALVGIFLQGKKISGKVESAFCKACFRQASHFPVVIKYLSEILENFSKNSLFTLGMTFYPAALMLLVPHADTLTLNDLFFLLEKYPERKQEILETAPEALRTKFQTYEELLYKINWEFKGLSIGNLSAYQEQFQSIGIVALNLTENELTKIFIAKILFSDNPQAFWATLENADKEKLCDLMLLDFRQSNGPAKVKEGSYIDSNLFFNERERTLMFKMFSLKLTLQIFCNLELDRCDPQNVSQYVEYILSSDSAEEPENTQEEILKLTYGEDNQKGASFLNLVRNNNPIVFECLKNGRALFEAMLKCKSYNLALFEDPKVRAGIAHLYFLHNVEPIPAELQEHYDAFKTLYSHIDKGDKPNPAAPRLVTGRQMAVPFFSELFAHTGFFFDLLFLSTHNNDIKLTLIDEAIKKINQDADSKILVTRHLSSLEALILSVLTSGTAEQIAQLLKIVSGKYSYIISNYLLSEEEALSNLKFLHHKVGQNRKSPTDKIEYDMSFTSTEAYLKKCGVINSILFYAPELIDQYTSAAAIADLQIEADAGSFLCFSCILQEELTITGFSDLVGKLNLVKHLKILKQVTKLAAENKVPTGEFDYPALFRELVEKAKQYLKTNPKHRFKSSFAWLSVIETEWFKNKIAAFNELKAALPGFRLENPSDDVLSRLTALLKRTNVDLKTLLLLKEALAPTLLWQAVLFIMRNTETLIIFEDAKKELQNQEYLPDNSGYLLEYYFYSIAEHTVNADREKTPSAAIMQMVRAHGDKIRPHLEKYNLITRHYRNADLSEKFEGVLKRGSNLEIQKINQGEIIAALRKRFEMLANTCPEQKLQNNEATQVLFEDIRNTAKEIKVPQLDFLRDTYSVQHQRDLPLWIARLALKDDTFAKAKLLEWKNSDFASEQLATAMSHTCKTLEEIKKLLNFNHVSELSDKLINAFLNNDDLFSLFITEFLENLKDLIVPKDQLTQSARDKIWAYMSHTCKTLEEIKKLLNFNHVSELSDKLINAFLNNDDLFSLFITEFLEHLKDLIVPKDQLTQSARDKIWAYLLKNHGTQNLLVQQLLADIKNPEKKLYAGMFFTPQLYCLALCEAYALENNLVEAEYWLAGARTTFAGDPVLSGEAKQLNEWMTLPDHYQHIRTEFSRDYAAIPVADTDARKVLADNYKAKYTALATTHHRLMQQQKQVSETIHKLHNHAIDLEQKKLACQNGKRDLDSAKKYAARIIAVNALKDDLAVLARDYYHQDFSERESNNNEFNAALSQKIKEHLSRKDAQGKDSVLKEHTGSKQVIYDLLAALTWILLPLSIYRAVTHKTLFYFHAKNTTEEILDDEIKPQLRSATAAAA